MRDWHEICMAWQRRGSVGAGLYNLGNKSFLNSILQRLTAESREGARGRSRAVPAPAVPSTGPSRVPVPPGAGSAQGRGVRSAQEGEEPLPHSSAWGGTAAAAVGGAGRCQPRRHAAPHGPVSQSTSQGPVVIRGVPGHLPPCSLPELARASMG